jgi:hypothetical protein
MARGARHGVGTPSPRQNVLSYEQDFARASLRAPMRYRNFSDIEIVLRVAKPNEPFAVLLASVDGLGLD